MSYSIDFRKKVLSVREKEGLSMAAVSQRFGVGKSSVMRWTKQISPKLTRQRPATKIDMECLKKDVEKYPDGYHYERAKRLGVSTSCVLYALRRLNITYKKNSKSSQSGSRKTIYLLPKDKIL